MKKTTQAQVFAESHTPEETLRVMRGTGSMCACGRPLKPVFHNGKRVGVSHSPEDEDHHIFFFTGHVYDQELNEYVAVRVEPQ